MKSIKQIENEMDSIQVEISTNKDAKPMVIKRMSNRYSFLSLCKTYLKTNPSNDFLDKEKERLNPRVNLINAQYVPDKRLIEAGLRKEEQKEHKDYNKIMGLPKCKDQLKAISFLLS